MTLFSQLKNVFLLGCLSISFNGFAQPTQQLIGIGQNSDVVITTSNAQSGTTGQNTLTNEGFLPNENAASRFLSQASFGPNYEEIAGLSDLGFENWIDHQFNNVPRAFNCLDKLKQITAVKNAGLNDPENTRPQGHFWDYTFWEYTMTSEDILRQRIAFALSEIFVISNKSALEGNAYAFSTFYDKLLDNSFGNYRDLLTEVTFHPAMAIYLTYMENPRQDTTYDIDYDVWPHDTLASQITFPDENYAREVMQLFTIGLCELNIDGTCQTDSDGVPIPTYDNVDIAEFAKIFTGLAWGDGTSFHSGPQSDDLTHTYPLKMYNERHDGGTKKLLNGTIIPKKNPIDGIGDIHDALDNLFNHPNVGPFFGKFLIQRLVTANPSPGYVERVAKAFNGETHYGNQRGDMKAVIKAILLDDEARSCMAQDDDNFGMLREPFIRYIQLARGFDLSSESGANRNAMYYIYNQMGQKVFASPSVFNFFQSDFQPIGPIEEAEKVAPVFQITNSQSIAGYLNLLNEWTIKDDIVDDWGRGFEEDEDPSDRPYLDLTDEILLTEDHRLPELLDRLDLILAHGKISQRSKDLMLPLLKEIPIDDDPDFWKRKRVQMAIYLIMASPEYLINR